MHVYGSRRGEAITCGYGCCGGPLSKAMKHTSLSKGKRKAAKKRARRLNREACDSG